jgi:hypothetical protein
LLSLAAKEPEPDPTLKEIRGCLATDKTFATSDSALLRFFDRHGISFKKHTAEPDREYVKAASEEGLRSSPQSAEERLIGKTPRSHWKLTTFIAALRRAFPRPRPERHWNT